MGTVAVLAAIQARPKRDGHLEPTLQFYDVQIVDVEADNLATPRIPILLW